MTPAQARQASLKALLRIEKAARVKLAASVEQVANRATVALSVGRDPHETLVVASHGIEHAASLDLATARAASRRESVATLEGELRANDVPILPVRRRQHEVQDRALAAAAAKVYAAGWLSAALERVVGGSAEVSTAAPKQATRATAERLKGIAITQTSSAFSSARATYTNDYAKAHAAAHILAPLPLKVWDATLDRRTCRRCEALHGTRRPWGLPFKGKAEPGQVHPRCRCVMGIEFLPVIPVGLGRAA